MRKNISMKRAQSRGHSGFARVMTIVALLLTAATGAWAQEPATTYSVKMKDGTVDAKNWTITSGEKSATGDAADGLTGLSKKDAVTLTYGGRLKVKSVTATTDAEPPAPVEGKFTINANGDQVIFAKGNLQAKTGDYGATWTWGFAEHQYDYIGNNVANTSINGNGTVSTNGTVDLFGWVGTSGNLTGIAAYGISNVGYETAADAYGNQTTDQLKHDWGELIGDGNTWRVLTAAEWDYITHKRKDKQGSDVDRYAKATVNGVPGLILFPDEYEHVVTPPTNINVNGKSAKFGDNQYDLAAWTLMENAGCIFLPASASRSKAVVSITTNYERGGYWTSTPHKTDGESSYHMRFDYQSVSSAITEKSGRYYGNAVRLVKSATAETVWDGDLSKLTAESTEKYATATNGMTITGTLAANVKVSIADGATVTLDNAVINGMNNDNYKWAGITCLGDATIILKDDTENTVKGFDAYYPGIQPAVGHKLIIKGGDQGTGKLTARSNGWAAGIGSGYGSGRPCGSIEIQGGNITATGGSRAAGIGSANGGTCGNITIASTVTKVTATKGQNAPYSIGAGDNGGTCGTVTIGGTKYWENNAAVDEAAATYLAQATIVYPAEEPVTLGTPLTMMATTAGTIKIVKPKSGMKYSVNGGEKTAITGTDDVTIPSSGSLSVGDKVAFYGEGTNIIRYQYTIIAGGTATVRVYGNIMSLVDEEGFATATELSSEMSAASTFYGLFAGNETLTDASGLLLPATTLSNYCYNQMFRGCTSLTAGPAELPAPELARCCYQGMFSGCTSLTAMPELKATKLGDGCYSSMFKDCKSLTAVPDKLPVETLQKACYQEMFGGCTGLTALPADFLPATTMEEDCYQLMFSGCTGLTAIPATLLKGTTLAKTCYESMFKGCTGLTAPPEDLLPATTMAQYCYQYMFSGCTGLESVPANLLKGTTLANYCYKSMFQGCTGLTAVPADFLPATTMKEYCYQLMFSGCTGLTAIPATLLKGTTLDKHCYRSMFLGCTGLTAIPEDLLPVETMAQYCYQSMFQGCTGLTTLPANLLKGTTLATYCYQSMFQGCTGLTAIPANLLKGTTLATYCYQSMFEGCESLTNAPNLDATTLANYCYNKMFKDCKSLTTLPALKATTLALSCYYGMFQGCTGLTTVPADLLPATAMYNSCYREMFQGCTSLTAGPAELPAESLASGCYQGMFSGCTSLTAAPVLPASTLVANCYNSMFKDCSNLASITCLAYEISNSNCTTDWVSGVAENGTFYKYSGTDWTSKTGTAGIPANWDVQNAPSN